MLSPAIAANKSPEKSPNKSSDKSSKKHQKVNEEGQPAVVWRDPGDVSTLDLFYGVGGKEHAPDPNRVFKFVKEDMSGTSPKFDVKDDKGMEWRVKLGEEPQSETAATRLLWAAGYFADEDYFLTDIKVQDLPRLRRGGNFVSADGTVHAARLERRIKSIKKLGTWDWFQNQCGPSQQLNGLRVMMAFVNNWDLKTLNNSVYEADGERRCVVTDVGATFGNTGNNFTRSKSVETDYVNSKFILKVTPEYVDFVMHTRPFIFGIFNVPNYITRTRMETITKHIPITDARWLGQRLKPLSADQIHDCFRSAGYTPEQIDGYTKAVQSRIAELNEL
jgi:hypothetical protein